MLGELPEEPEWAKDLTETETNPVTAFYGRMDISAQLADGAISSFLVSLKHEIKARNDTVDIVMSLNNFRQYLHFVG